MRQPRLERWRNPLERRVKRVQKNSDPISTSAFNAGSRHQVRSTAKCVSRDRLPLKTPCFGLNPIVYCVSLFRMISNGYSVKVLSELLKVRLG